MDPHLLACPLLMAIHDHDARGSILQGGGDLESFYEKTMHSLEEA